MRAFLATAAIAGAMLPAAVAAESTIDALLALEGETLFNVERQLAYDWKDRLSADELVAFTAKLLAAERELPKEHPHRGAFTSYFEKACGKAGAPQLERLVDIYSAIDPGGFDRQGVLAPLATAWLMNDLAARGEIAPVELPPFAGTLPPGLADAPQELVAAWQLYKRATQAFDAAFRGPERQHQTISFQMNKRSFYQVIDGILQGRGENLAEQLAAYAWSGWCGTGSDSLERPQAIGLLIALLQEGRIREAIGAAVHLQSDRPLISADGRQNARIEFLKRCGLDWESLMAGARIDSDLGLSYAGWNAATLQEMAAFGSDRAAALIVQMSRRAPREQREPYARALATLVPGDTGHIEGGTIYGGEIKRSPDVSLSAEAKASVVVALHEFARPDAPSRIVEHALVGLARARSAESKPALRELLKHPSPAVTKMAAHLLRLLGETNAAAPAAAPVRFHLSFNGTPVRSGTSIGWQLNFGGGGSTSSSTPADESGTVQIDREDFLDHAQPVTAVVLSGARGNDPVDEPYFHVAVPVPVDLDAVTAVDVPLARMELRVDRLGSVAADAADNAKVEIRRQEPKRDPADPYTYFDDAPWRFEVPLGRVVNLSLQSGEYTLKVIAAGSAKHTSALTIGPTPTPVSVALKPGGAMRFKAVRPDGEEIVRTTLLHEGKELEHGYFDWHAKTWEGLPAGNYILRIPSSTEAYPVSEMGRDRTPLVAYRARDIPFTITGASAEVVDLGEIRLEAGVQ